MDRKQILNWKTAGILAVILLLIAGLIKYLPQILSAQSSDTAQIESEPFTKKRMEMVEETIISRGLKDRQVIAAMQSVPRHMFVPDQYLDQAYADHPLPIGYGQTISQPYIVAMMTELLDLKRGKESLRLVPVRDIRQPYWQSWKASKSTPWKLYRTLPGRLQNGWQEWATTGFIPDRGMAIMDGRNLPPMMPSSLPQHRTTCPCH